MPSEEKIVREAIEQLSAHTGLQVNIQPKTLYKLDEGYDHIITIDQVQFKAIVKSSITQGNKNLLYAPLAKVKHAAMPFLIIAERIPTDIAKEYVDAGINYLDKAGNCNIRLSNLKIHIEGKKAEKSAGSYQSRAFQEAGIRLIFHLLNDPAAVNLPYRDLAVRTGLSLGSVSSVLRELADLDFVFEAGKKRVLKSTAQLLDRWVIAYHDVLRPRLLTKRLRFTEPNQLSNWASFPLQSSDHVLFWGGEPAAALLTNYLTPEKFTLYTNGRWQDVMRMFKLLPADDGEIEVLDLFWYEQDKYREKPIVPPLLIYADLMGSRIGRNLETANLIRENELSSLLPRV